MEEKKRALLVTTVSGFVPQFEMNNVRLLQELGYEVHYAANFRNPGYGKDNRRLEGTGIVCHQIEFVRSPFALADNLLAYRQLRQLLSTQYFELLHCHTPVGAALARLAAHNYNQHKVKCSGSHENKIRVIYTAHGFHFYKGAPLRFWLFFYPAERFLARYTDVLITINQEDYERAKRFCKYKKTQVEHISGAGVDIAYFSGRELPEGERARIRKQIRNKLAVRDDEVLLLSVGELTPRKNHAAVIKALAEIQKKGLADTVSFRYVICGQGRLKDKLQRLIEEYGLSGNVQLLGYQQDIRELLYAADAFVFPSLQEGMPMALMEAVAAGVPLLASDVRGNRELLRVSNDANSFSNKKELRQGLLRILRKGKD